MYKNNNKQNKQNKPSLAPTAVMRIGAVVQAHVIDRALVTVGAVRLCAQF